jgi:NarL family two-component system sensor histidine kinase YdfH
MQKIRSFLSANFGSWRRETEMPFMAFLTFVFALIYIWTVIDSARMRQPVLLIVFTVLFNLHLILHWMSISWFKQKWNIWLYLGVQALLVFILVSLAGVMGPLFGLYLGMIGESVGLLVKPRRIAAGVAFFLLLSMVNYLQITGGADAQWWMLAMIPMTIFVIIYVVLYSRQADARARAQQLLEELRQANRRLTEYAGQIEDLTLADERARMARELHDTLAQDLAGLILQLEAADAHLQKQDPGRAREIIAQAMKRARTTLAQSRRVIDDLRAGFAGADDLAEAVREEAGRFSAATGISCALDLDLPPDLPVPVRDQIFRAVSEGLNNIARHAQARSAQVAARAEDGALVIRISDDGVGFDLDSVPPGHYGLLGLRERVRLAGGSIEIASRAGAGTSLNMRFPLQPMEGGGAGGER